MIYSRDRDGRITAAWISRFPNTTFHHQAQLPWPIPASEAEWESWISGDSGRAGIYADFLLWAEGKDLAYEFRTIAPPLPPVEQVVAEAHNAIAARAKSQIDAAVGITSAFEVGGWERKRIEAEQVQSGAVLPSDSMLVQEAAAAGITVAELADLIQQKAAQFVSLSAQIKGTERKHKLAIDAIAADPLLSDAEKIDQIRSYNYQGALDGLTNFADA